MNVPPQVDPESGTPERLCSRSLTTDKTRPATHLSSVAMIAPMHSSSEKSSSKAAARAPPSGMQVLHGIASTPVQTNARLLVGWAYGGIEVNARYSGAGNCDRSFASHGVRAAGVGTACVWRSAHGACRSRADSCAFILAFLPAQSNPVPHGRCRHPARALRSWSGPRSACGHLLWSQRLHSAYRNVCLRAHSRGSLVR